MLTNYGVVVGTYDHAGTHQGQWLHELIYLRAGGQLFECAVDVNEPNGIFQYQLLGGLDPGMFQPISLLPDGYHPLGRNAGSGAIDYLRSPLILQPQGCLAVFFGFISAIFGSKPASQWHDVTGNEAGNALAGLVSDSVRVYVFGEPYDDPNPLPGMHNIHMNQGDPINSSHHADDGIWQDGCVIVEGADRKLTGYLGKFATQSLETDDNGWPT